MRRSLQKTRAFDSKATKAAFVAHFMTLQCAQKMSTWLFVVFINLVKDVIDGFIQGYFFEQRGNIIGDNNLIFLTVRSFSFYAKSSVFLIVCWFSASGNRSDQVATRSVFERLLERVTKETVFSFNEMLHKKVDGQNMDNPL